MKIEFIERSVLKEKPLYSDLRFGKYFTDYMFVMDYENEWKNPRIIPYEPISIDPASIVLQYAVQTFEGMKAYRNDDEIYLFRPEMHAKRLNKSNHRLCIPAIDEDIFIEAVESLVKIEKDWIPDEIGYSLYLRPFIIGIDESLAVKKSRKYQFIIVASPVPNYYFLGNDLMNIYVEDVYVRSILGGTGDIKCGANYASTILASKNAYQQGYDQVLWLDGIHRKYIEEVGTMNIFFVIDNVVYTPSLNGSILSGITRDSIITILRDLNYEVIEGSIEIDFIMNSIEDKSLSEAFGCGTAALIAPIKTMTYQDKTMLISNEIGPISKLLYDELTSIQWGLKEDKVHFRYKIK